MALITERWWGPLFVLYGLVNRTGNCHYVATAGTGGIKKIPDKLIVLEAGHHIEDFTATRADVDRAKRS